MKKQIIISDFVNELIDEEWSTIAEEIEVQYEGEDRLSAKGEVDELGGVSLNIPNCSVRIYYSDNKITLDEVQEKHIRQLFGDLDVFGENYGYSEWTIMGFNLESLTVGGHNLIKELENNMDRYANIVIEYEN